MKKTSLIRRGGTLLAFTMIIMAAEARTSRLFLTTPTHKATAIISGNQYFSHDGIFHITHLRPGNHFVRVTTQRNRTHGRNQNRGQITTVFKGQIVIPHQSDVYARVTPRGGLIIEQVIPLRVQRPRNNVRRGGGVDYGTDGLRYGQRGQNRFDNNNIRRGERTPAPNNYAKSNFEIAINMLNQADFESEKKSIARQYLIDNNVTSKEVLRMIQLLDFESSRLEIAKAAYNRTVDPENYFIVNQGFQFSSSSRALDRHIRLES